MRRNEVGAVISTRNVQQAMTAGSGDLAIYVEDERQQRAGLFLRDVAYRLHANLEPVSDEARANPQKYREMFARRAAKGQCVNQPYLGCREFAADFRLVDEIEAKPPPLPETRELGWMLHDLDFSNRADPKPRFFQARLVNGVLDIPPFDSPEVRG